LPKEVERTRSCGKDYSSAFLWYETHSKQNDAFIIFCIVACVFFASGTSLPSRSLATVRRYAQSNVIRRYYVFVRNGWKKNVSF
jgi:hypothetical protein